MVRVGIVGTTGYVGLELIRLLSQHEQADVVYLASQSYEGRRIEDVYPSLRGCISMELKAVDYAAMAKACDVVFTALPHGAAADAVTELAGGGVRVIDMSADFRYDDPEVYAKWYKQTHKNPQLMREAVYGLPELYRERIKGARVVGNPGCYTTCAILTLAPLLRAGVVKADNLIVDAKSGVTGAGAKPTATVHFTEVDESLKAYSVATHRHTSEIEQELSHAAGEEITLSFTPHLLPIKRGILSTVYANLAPGKTAQDAMAAYTHAYDAEPFVNVYPQGELPEIKHIAGSNFCSIGFVHDARLNRLVIVSCLDNMVKGSGGAAVQNMNIMFGLDEKMGIGMPGLYL
jgi:N-acetyl-gamma-glutamyl-phosphate reductase